MAGVPTQSLPAYSEMNISPQAKSTTESEAMIAVMGATGTGKSTFINLVSGSHLRIGMGLHSCTYEVEVARPFKLDGCFVTLIDTPGFDDTEKSDFDILNMISTFLAESYRKGTKLAGVIYLHRISDFRFGGISARNFKMFRKLCGDDALKNVLIVTNMWGEVTNEKGEAREAELVNTLDSAQNIVSRILQNKPEALQIQTEIVVEGKDFSMSKAAEELNRQLQEMMKKHEKEMNQLRKEMEDAIKEKDELTRRELEVETRKVQEMMKKVQDDTEKLTSKLEREKRELEQTLRKEKEKVPGLSQVDWPVNDNVYRSTQGDVAKYISQYCVRVNTGSNGKGWELWIVPLVLGRYRFIHGGGDYIEILAKHFKDHSISFNSKQPAITYVQFVPA